MIDREYHIHTHFCDGKDSPKEMLDAAVTKGYKTLGFSGHSQILDEDWGMSEVSALAYASEIKELKNEYAEKIEVLCGIEQDYYSPPPLFAPDYVIGSVHCVKAGDKYIAVDDTVEILISLINNEYSGDALSVVEEYYKCVGNVVDKTGADIIGHLDLITKFEEISPMFHPDSAAYLQIAESAVKKLCKTGALFEVNTGAMARKYRTTPYPDVKLLHIIKENGGRVILSSDCHDKEKLGYGFSKACKLLKECGFQNVFYLSQNTVHTQKI